MFRSALLGAAVALAAVVPSSNAEAQDLCEIVRVEVRPLIDNTVGPQCVPYWLAADCGLTGFKVEPVLYVSLWVCVPAPLSSAGS